MDSEYYLTLAKVRYERARELLEEAKFFSSTTISFTGEMEHSLQMTIR